MSQAIHALRHHWPEYLIEAWGLGMFMVSAGVVVTLLEYPDSPARQMIAEPAIRRALVGAAMGLTAIGIIYSPWGQQSGAHINPAVTLAFTRLGKVAPWDAVFYIAAQFIGGTLGVLLVVVALGNLFTQPPVNYVATVPGTAGAGIAFAAEFMISMGLMVTILLVSNTERLARFTGICAGILVAIYITVEAPLSGMSMNPARTFASAAPGNVWSSVWIYFSAPIFGMLASVEIYRQVKREPKVRCPKLHRTPRKRCIHCGYDPSKSADFTCAVARPAGGRG